MALVIAMLAIMLVQVFFRRIVNDSLLWSEDVAVWGLIWVVYLGSVHLMRNWEHVSIPMVVIALPLRLRIWVIIASKLLVLVFLGALAWYGLEVVLLPFHNVSTGTGISSRWIKLAVPVGSILMTVTALRVVLDDFRALAAGELDRFRRFGRFDVHDEA